MKELMKFVGYSILSALIFLAVYSLFFNPYILVDKVEDTGDFLKSIKEKTKGSEEELKIPTKNNFITPTSNDFDYSLRYEENETTDFIVISFEDHTGYLTKKCYRIVQRTATSDRTLCEECSEESSGEIYCSIHELANSKERGILIGNFHLKEPILMTIDWRSDLYDILEDYVKNM